MQALNLTSSKKVLNQWPFSHIYMEKKAIPYPATQDILKQCLGTPVIEIDSYKEVFNRSESHFQLQKSLPKLLLAVKQEPFIHKGSEKINSFGLDLTDLYYTAQIRNCVYNCEYCILQAIHPSSYIVIYVNIQDFIEAAKRESVGHQHLFLSISYLSDVLAFEKLYPSTRLWIEALKETNILLEIRTKTNHFQAINDLDFHQRVILTWSLSPKRVIQLYEKGTASLSNRLLDIEKALSLGCRVRICFDPILFFHESMEAFQIMYREFLAQVFTRLDSRKIDLVNYGFFRLSLAGLKKLRGLNRDARLLYGTLQIKQNEVAYQKVLLKQMGEFFHRELLTYVEQQKIVRV